MVESNSEDLIISASKKAFKHLPNLKKAIEELTVLKAVGPATASGNGSIILSIDSMSNFTYR